MARVSKVHTWCRKSSSLKRFELFRQLGGEYLDVFGGMGARASSCHEGLVVNGHSTSLGY